MTKPATKKKVCFTVPFLYLNLILLILIILFTSLGIYFFHFKRQPIDQILASNQAIISNRKEETPKFSEVVDNEAVRSGERWDEWATEQGLVAIGNIYDSCNETNRLHIGRVVMKQDPVTKKLVTETVFNITLTKELHKGRMHMTTDYNGRRFITKEWSLCRNEENKYSEEIILDCPIKQGVTHLVKQKKIPGYLPKGRYSVKLWTLDDNDNIIVCGWTELAL